MARTVLPIVGAAVGAYFGGPTGAQIGYALGSVVGNAVDPVKVQGPKIGETGVQTTAEGVPRPIIYGTISCTGNVIVAGPLVITEEETQEGKGGGPVTTSERAFRTFAIRICEGQVARILRIWEDEKLVYDIRQGSGMGAESVKWALGTRIYGGSEDQLPDSALENVNPDMPAYRGTAYIVFDGRDLTDRRGSIPQYRFEVAKSISNEASTVVVGPTSTKNTFLGVNELDYPMMIQNQTNGTGFQVGLPGSYDVSTYTTSFTSTSPLSTVTINNAGDTAGDTRIYPIAFDETRQFALSFDPNSGYCKLLLNGAAYGYFKPTIGASDSWWYNEGGYFPEYGGLVFFSGVYVYLGVRKTGSSGTIWDSVFKFPIAGGTVYPVATLSGVTGGASSPIFWMHVSRDDTVRTIAYNGAGVINVYDEDLVFQQTVSLPSAVAARFPSSVALLGFGVDEAKDTAIYVYRNGADGYSTAYIYSNSSGELLHSEPLASSSPTAVTTRIVFTDDGAYIQRDTRAYFIPIGVSGGSIILGEIVADIADRCGLKAEKFDVSELTDEVAGLLLAGDYNGADAINTLRAPYFFDGYNADKKIWFPKRGADASFVIDIDDLVEDPDTSKREQAIEYPKKIHLQYQHANSGYAIVKATSARSSPDARVVGETTLSVPIVLNEDQAAQTAAKMHKVAWAEADGEITLSMPDSFIQYTPTDVGSVTLRGKTTRSRITEWDYADGVIKWTLKKDRQSAYTSDVQGVPVPDPTPPPGTITGETILAVMDIPSRTDSEDDLNIYYGVTGAMPAWYGATVQRSLDAGANFTNVATINQASIIGYTNNAIADASEWYTDTTNTLSVTLYRDGQQLESLTDAQFLSEGGAFALEKADGSWEVMQYRDCVETSNGDFLLSTFHRGQLSSGTEAHASGALFVMLERPTHVVTQSSMIGQSVVHRAPSLGQSPELADEQTATYVGRSQIEWPVASFNLLRDASNVVTATWRPRHRFGTDDAPVASINFQGFRVTKVELGVTTVTDTTAQTYTVTTSNPVTISVQALNRITGAGPTTSGTI